MQAQKVLEKIEALLLKEFQTVPFHNLFMLNGTDSKPSQLGGTCSDKTLHFKAVLGKNRIKTALHSAFINNQETHRMLRIDLAGKRYFIDVGSAWPTLQLFPADEEVEYQCFGMGFKTKIRKDEIVLYHRSNEQYKEMIVIPFREKTEDLILDDIARRYDDTYDYPFRNSLRFSQILGDSFYFLKGNDLRRYNEKEGYRVMKDLQDEEIKLLLANLFNFKADHLFKIKEPAMWY